jgi:hypothetical protein
VEEMKQRFVATIENQKRTTEARSHGGRTRTRYLVLDVRYLVFGIWSFVFEKITSLGRPGNAAIRHKYQLPNTNYLIPNTRYVVLAFFGDSVVPWRAFGLLRCDSLVKLT